MLLQEFLHNCRRASEPRQDSDRECAQSVRSDVTQGLRGCDDQCNVTERKQDEGKQEVTKCAGCPMKEEDSQRYSWLKDKFIVSSIDKDNADLMAL